MIDRAITETINPALRKYADEVIFLHESKQYRSSIIQLWLISIMDLLKKLSHLRDQFQDATAQKILAEIDLERTRNPKSSSWEEKLIERAFKEAGLIDVHGFTVLDCLNKNRNLCAHPNWDDSFNLIQIGRSTSASFIEDTFTHVLSKPALISSKMIDSILNDIKNMKSDFVKRKDLFEYINRKFVSKLAQKSKRQVIKAMFKICYCDESALATDNRDHNQYVYEEITQLNSAEFIELAEIDRAYYSRYSDNEASRNGYLKLMQRFPLLWRNLPEEKQIHLRELASRNIYIKLLTFHEAENIHEHLKSTYEDMQRNYGQYEYDPKPINLLWQRYEGAETRKLLFKICNLWYSRSANYDDADMRYDVLIEPYYREYDAELFSDLFSKIGSYGQVVDRRKAKRIHTELITYAIGKFGDIFNDPILRAFRASIDM